MTTSSDVTEIRSRRVEMTTKEAQEHMRILLDASVHLAEALHLAKDDKKRPHDATKVCPCDEMWNHINQASMAIKAVKDILRGEDSITALTSLLDMFVQELEKTKSSVLKLISDV